VLAYVGFLCAVSASDMARYPSVCASVVIRRLAAAMAAALLHVWLPYIRLAWLILPQQHGHEWAGVSHVRFHVLSVAWLCMFMSSCRFLIRSIVLCSSELQATILRHATETGVRHVL